MISLTVIRFRNSKIIQSKRIQVLSVNKIRSEIGSICHMTHHHIYKLIVASRFELWNDFFFILTLQKGSNFIVLISNWKLNYYLIFNYRIDIKNYWFCFELYINIHSEQNNVVCDMSKANAYSVLRKFV